jgi:hypothetical protein
LPDAVGPGFVALDGSFRAENRSLIGQLRSVARRNCDPVSRRSRLQYRYEQSKQALDLRDLHHHPGQRRTCERGCIPLNALDEDSKRYRRLRRRGFANRSSSRGNCVLESHLRGFGNSISAWRTYLCYRHHSRRRHSIARQAGPPRYSLANDARKPGTSARGFADHPIWRSVHLVHGLSRRPSHRCDQERRYTTIDTTKRRSECYRARTRSRCGTRPQPGSSVTDVWTSSGLPARCF